MLSDLPTPWPGYSGRIGADTATIAQVLRLNGYSTAMFGKHHNSPSTDRSLGASADTWPTGGLGFAQISVRARQARGVASWSAGQVLLVVGHGLGGLAQLVQGATDV